MNKVAKFFGEGKDIHLTIAQLDVIVDALDTYDRHLRKMFDNTLERRIEYIDQKALTRRIELASKSRRVIMRALEP